MFTAPEAGEWSHGSIPIERHDVGATHGAGCTHSAALCAGLARGLSLIEAAEGAARVAEDAVAHGLTDIGAGDGPVDVLNLKEAREHDRDHALDRR